ncbi:unnamed protein product [Ciceribacter sp. T2.26MG-112.2]|nr:unnamed protein product [Ciceribacter naphthalenivorans]
MKRSLSGKAGFSQCNSCRPDRIRRKQGFAWRFDQVCIALCTAF